MSRTPVFVILFLSIVIGVYSFTFMPNLTEVTNVPDCLEDKGVCYGSAVSEIIDGDTMKTTDNASIRFALSSAPELSENGGIEAKEFIKELCPVGSKIIIDEDDNQLDGSYGKVIAKVICNGINLNESLIENNHGVIDTRYCNSEFSEESWAVGCSR